MIAHLERLGTWRVSAERHPVGGEYGCSSGALLALTTARASLGALDLTAFLGSLAITRETEVIGLPQQTLACAVVVVAAGAQLSQVMLANGKPGITVIIVSPHVSSCGSEEFFYAFQLDRIYQGHIS